MVIPGEESMMSLTLMQSHQREMREENTQGEIILDSWSLGLKTMRGKSGGKMGANHFFSLSHSFVVSNIKFQIVF